MTNQQIGNTLCGTLNKFRVEGTSNYVKVVFVSDSTGTNKGWGLQWGPKFDSAGRKHYTIFYCIISYTTAGRNVLLKVEAVHHCKFLCSIKL